eukprot:m.166954 g.166954  ORF g.166954 m.166954 type:complete len:265 (-) comp18178_c0_seq1:264-1058(-)
MNLIILLLEDFISRIEHETPNHSTTDLLKIITGDAELRDERRVSHIRDVLRAESGDVLKVGQLGCRIGTATLHFPDDTKTSVLLKDVRLDKVCTPPAPIVLILALPEKDHFTQILHSVTVLGVKKIYLIDADEVSASCWGSHAIQRDALYETMLLGLEQTIDTDIPQVFLRRDVDRFLADELPGIVASSRQALMLDSSAATTPAHMGGVVDGAGPTTLLIGPANNFTAREQTQYQALGFERISFGRRVVPLVAAVRALVGRWSM